MCMNVVILRVLKNECSCSITGNKACLNYYTLLFLYSFYNQVVPDIIGLDGSVGSISDW